MITRWLLVAGMVVCFFGGARATELLDSRAYTEAVAKALASALPNRTVTVTGELELNVRRSEGVQTVWLGNSYGDYQRDPAQFNAIVGVYVGALTEPPDREAVAAMPDRAGIVPVVKDRQWINDNVKALRDRGVNVDFVYDELNDDLVVVYAEDGGTRVRYLMSNEDLGVDREGLRSLAVANLERLLPKIEMSVHEYGFAWFSAGGDYEASLLLFDSIWNGGQIVMDGDIVVAVPAKDVLLVTGSRNERGLAAVRQLAAEYVQDDYGLTATLFVYRDGHFARFDGG